MKIKETFKTDLKLVFITKNDFGTCSKNLGVQRTVWPWNLEVRHNIQGSQIPGLPLVSNAPCTNNLLWLTCYNFVTWLLGYRIKFSGIYIPQGHYFISILWLWSTDEYVKF